MSGLDPGGAERGQTLPDFTVAIGIFLVTVAFISLFVPQIIQPFQDQEQPVVAERVASDLTRSTLTDGGTAVQLNESSVISVFGQSERDLLDAIGIDRSYSLNVTIRNASSQVQNSRILCASNGTIGGPCGDRSDQLAVGDPVPQDDRSVATTRRTAFVGDRDVVIEVGVW